jgi:hypothetical protein
LSSFLWSICCRVSGTKGASVSFFLEFSVCKLCWFLLVWLVVDVSVPDARIVLEV